NLSPTTLEHGPNPARYPPYHQLSTVNSNARARLGTITKPNTLVGPQLHQGGANHFQVKAARALWLLVPILIGASAATQTLAARLNYHPSLGPNLFHLYPPWAYFIWSYLWRHTNPPIFAQ